MRRTVITAVCTGTLLFGFTPAADASTYQRSIGNDSVLVTHGYVARSGHAQEHRKIAVFDRTCDGKRFKAVYVIGGFSKRYNSTDLNGCLPGGTARNWNDVPGGHEIRSFKACVRNFVLNRHVWKCTRWKRVYSDLPV